MKNKKVAFYLSGGGVPAIESIGAMIEALRDVHHITPDFMTSCSGGGIPAHLITHGIDIFNFIQDVKVSNYIKIRNIFELATGKSLYDVSKLKLLLEELTGYEFNENHEVNLTDVTSKQTYYAKANSQTVLGSMSIPEVFPSQFISAKARYYEENMDFTKPKSLDIKEVELNSVECCDGGIYDVIPTPVGEDYYNYDKIYVLVCSGSNFKVNTVLGRVRRSIDWILNVMEREYKQLLSDYSNDKKVTILRPPDYSAPLLDWSKDFECYKNSYNYIKNLNL